MCALRALLRLIVAGTCGVFKAYRRVNEPRKVPPQSPLCFLLLASRSEMATFLGLRRVFGRLGNEILRFLRPFTARMIESGERSHSTIRLAWRWIRPSQVTVAPLVVQVRYRKTTPVTNSTQHLPTAVPVILRRRKQCGFSSFRNALERAQAPLAGA